MPAKKKIQFSRRPKAATVAAKAVAVKANKASALLKAGSKVAVAPLKYPFDPSVFEGVEFNFHNFVSFLSETSHVTQGHVIITHYEGHVEINRMFHQQKVCAN